MSENPAERRDVAGVISDMRVDIATIKTRMEANGVTLTRLEGKLDLGIFREEYERRHRELELKVEAAERAVEVERDESMRRQGAQRVWRWLYGAAIAALSLVVALIQAKVI